MFRKCLPGLNPSTVLSWMPISSRISWSCFGKLRRRHQMLDNRRRLISSLRAPLRKTAVRLECCSDFTEENKPISQPQAPTVFSFEHFKTWPIMGTLTRRSRWSLR